MNSLSEADTHAKLVNPAIYKKGWTEDHIKREETTGAVDIIAGKARRRSNSKQQLTRNHLPPRPCRALPRSLRS